MEPLSPTRQYSCLNHPNSNTFNLNRHQDQLDDQREPLFEKHLTPSDVGKRNRLVIPKQHAERCFPLGATASVHHNKGLLLSFEDESGKCWRFRYSYWSSSQSYVLTKGWSRYVKEKQLAAGDIILFQRHCANIDRLFIGWRRRGAAVTGDGGSNGALTGNNSGGCGGGGNEGWSSTCCRGLHRGQGHPYLGHIQGYGANVPYQPDCLHAGSMDENQAAAGNPKRLLRLFGVDVECQLDDTHEISPVSIHVQTTASPPPTSFTLTPTLQTTW